jgi:hypothetical protein
MSIQGISGGYAHELGTANAYCWGAITPPTAPDTCWTRSAAGEIAAGQGGAAGDGTGGVKLAWLHTMLSTANTGSCTSAQGGYWSFGADGTVTRCPSGGGTWTAFGGGSFTAAGDLAGSSSTQEVVGIHSVPLCTGFTPTAGQLLAYTTSSSPNPCWTAQNAPGGSFSAGGDLAGSSSSQQVVGVNSVPLCTGFTPTNSQVLTYTTASSPNPCWTAAAGGGGGSATGLFSQIMSATPTLSGTGLTTAYNQAGTFSATNGPTGITVEDSVSNSSDLNEGVVRVYPSTPFTLTTLFSVPLAGTNGTSAGPWGQIIVASDLTSSGKLESFGVGVRNQSPYFSGFDVLGFKWNNATSYNTYAYSDYLSSVYVAPAYMWIEYKDDGTTVTVSRSTDGSYYKTLMSETKSSGFLGASGYSYIGIGLDNFNNEGGSTLMSWTITNP